MDGDLVVRSFGVLEEVGEDGASNVTWSIVAHTKAINIWRQITKRHKRRDDLHTSSTNE